MPDACVEQDVRLSETESLPSRRRLLKAGGAMLLAGAVPAILPSRARAQRKTLKILQWKHFVPSYDRWFDESFIKEWGQLNDTEVIVDHVGIADINKLARAEMQTKRGHDLVLFIMPPAEYEDHVLDLGDLYQECEHKYGKPPDFILKSSYNPTTRKYFGFCGFYLPAVLTYRKGLWDAVGGVPDTWQNVFEIGRKIKLLYDKPVGISLAPEQNSGHTMRSIMYSFGSSEQDIDGNPTLRSKATLEVIKYVKSLYEEAMPEEVLRWDPASNNRFMLEGAGSLTLDTISIARASEKMGTPLATDLWLAKPPAGPTARLAPSFGFMTYIIWQFADNVDGAKKFLVDYVASSRQGLLASGFQNIAACPRTVPDLPELVTKDVAANPPDRYRLLDDVASWTTNIGYPGYSNPAISEIYTEGIIPTMCAHAATGQLTPEEALEQADGEARRIFQKWKERGKV
jgi:multiple sugar transport system substrate-binding protein